MTKKVRPNQILRNSKQKFHNNINIHLKFFILWFTPTFILLNYILFSLSLSLTHSHVFSFSFSFIFRVLFFNFSLWASSSDQRRSSRRWYINEFGSHFSFSSIISARFSSSRSARSRCPGSPRSSIFRAKFFSWRRSRDSKRFSSLVVR